MRFTDYGLDGASRNVYFYAAAEINDAGKMSDLSEVAGPIQLVNARPPPAPVIRSVRSQVEGFDDATGARDTRVVVRVNPFPQGENVSQVALYRATNAQAALNVRLMTEVGAFAPDEDSVDTFADVEAPPYGMPIFYRVVALREIANERGDRENVPSPPSKVALANVVDVNRPTAPELVATAGAQTATELESHLELAEDSHSRDLPALQAQRPGIWTRFYEVNRTTSPCNIPPATTLPPTRRPPCSPRSTNTAIRSSPFQSASSMRRECSGRMSVR